MGLDCNSNTHRSQYRKIFSARLLVPEKPSQVHATSTAHHTRAQNLSQGRLPRNRHHTRRVVGPQRRPETQQETPAELFHAVQGPAAFPKKRGLEKFFARTIVHARRHDLIDERSKLAAVDSTGYEAGHASTYYSKRCGLERSHYPKLTIVCDTESHLVLSAVADRGPLPDDAEFAAAVRLAHRAERFDCLLADAGYDSEKNHTFVREEIGSSSIIPPLSGRRNGKPPHGRYRREMFEDFPQSLYGQSA